MHCLKCGKHTVFKQPVHINGQQWLGCMNCGHLFSEQRYKMMQQAKFVLALLGIAVGATCAFAALLFYTGAAFGAEHTVSFSWEYNKADEARIDGYRILAVADPDIIAVDNIPPESRAVSVTMDDGGANDCRDMYIVAFKGSRLSERSNVVSVCPSIPAVVNFKGIAE